jgi:hypothetical protein
MVKNNVEMEKLEKRRRTRRRLNAEGSADLWDEGFLYEESDLFNRSKVDRGSLDGIGGDAEP